MIKLHRTIHMHCINVNILILLMYYSYVRYKHWRKLGEGYTGPFWTIFATSYEFIITSRYKFF